MDMAQTSLPENEPKIVTTRTFAAPLSLVYKAFTDPAHVGNWWGPDGFTITTSRMDVRVGGEWVFVMHGPDGKDWPNRITYLEVTQTRLHFRHDTGNDDPDDPYAFLSTIMFEQRETGTKVTMIATLRSVEVRDAIAGYAVEGGKQTLNKAAAYIESMGEAPRQSAHPTHMAIDGSTITLERIFAAPIATVFAAFTEAEHLRQWFGPRTLAGCEVETDPRQGGAFRITIRMADADYPIKGTFTEYEPPSFVAMLMDDSEHPVAYHEAFTNLYRAIGGTGMPSHTALVEYRFEDLGKETKMKFRIIFGDATVRAASIAMGFSGGWSDSFDKLEEYLAG